MKKIYTYTLKVSLSIVLILLMSASQIFASSQDSDKNSGSNVKSIWRYVQDQTKYSPEDGIAQKIYFLSLNSDGTYHQYVKVIPISPKDYFRVKDYAVDGKWSSKSDKLILNEYGKENAIDYSFLYSNFENIDNQIVQVAK